LPCKDFITEKCLEQTPSLF